MSYPSELPCNITTPLEQYLHLFSPSAAICLIVVASCSYFFGTIPFGLIISKFFLNLDIRNTGSGNIGATNVLRTGNKKLAFFTLILDAAKGTIPILILILLDVDKEPIKLTSYCAPAYMIFALSLGAGLGAILGHCFPVWLKFKGGKGVATALGALLAAVPFAGLAAAGAWIATAFLFKISSLAALVAVGIAPIVTYFFYGGAPATVCFLITLLVWFRHKDNIKRLIAGTEPKIGAK